MQSARREDVTLNAGPTSTTGSGTGEATRWAARASVCCARLGAQQPQLSLISLSSLAPPTQHLVSRSFSQPASRLSPLSPSAQPAIAAVPFLGESALASPPIGLRPI